MWNRTKRLINSYLDGLIERASSPDRGVRDITRAELARLSELEVQSRASAKLFEKELAEVELKLTGTIERERLMREHGDEAAAANASRLISSLVAQRDLLKQQLAEASSAADRAKSLRERRRVEGEGLATETHLTSMRENLAGLQSPFGSTDPAATIDEMRERIGRSVTSADANVAEADRRLAEARAKAEVENLLTRYKQGLSSTPQVQPTTAPSSDENAAPAPESDSDESQPGNSKSLGRNSGPVNPID